MSEHLWQRLKNVSQQQRAEARKGIIACTARAYNIRKRNAAAQKTTGSSNAGERTRMDGKRPYLLKEMSDTSPEPDPNLSYMSIGHLRSYKSL